MVDATCGDPVRSQRGASTDGFGAVDHVERAARLAHAVGHLRQPTTTRLVGDVHHHPWRHQRRGCTAVVGRMKEVGAGRREPPHRRWPIGGEEDRRRPAGGVMRRCRLHLDDHHRHILRELGGRRESRHPGSDHDDVDRFGHRYLPKRSCVVGIERSSHADMRVVGQVRWWRWPRGCR